MPRIRPYEQQLSTEQGIPAQQAQGSDFGGPGLQHLGQAVVSAGQDIGYAQRVMAANYSRKAVTDVHSFFSNTRAEYTKRARELEISTKAEDAEGIWQQFAFGNGQEDAPGEGSFKWYLDSYGEKITDPEAKMVFQQLAAQHAEHFSNHFVNVQAKLEGVHAQQQHARLLDGAQATVQTDPSQYENTLAQTLNALNDPRTIYGRLTDAQKEPMRRRTVEDISSSAVRGMIGDSPQHALRSIQAGEWDKVLSGEQKIVLTKSAETAIRAQETEAARAEADANRQRIAAARAIETTLITKLAAHMDDPAQPPLTAGDVLQSNLAKLDPEKAKGILSLIHAWSKEDPDKVKTDRSTFDDLFMRIHAPYGDEKKITDETPIIAAASGHKLSRTDFDWLRKEFEQSRSSDGAKIGEEMAAFVSSSKSAIDKSNPLMGKIDPEGGLKYGEFQHFVRRQVEQSRKDNKDPQELFDPSSPRYLGKQIGRFQKTMQESMATMQERMRKGNQRSVAPPTELAPELRRLPGETPAQYLERREKMKP